MRTLVCVLALLIGAQNHAEASSESVGPNGIKSIGLMRPDGEVLTGAGVNIGQVEPDRVPLRGTDDDDESNQFVAPTTTVTKAGIAPTPNLDISTLM